MADEFKLEGLDELDRKLEALEKDLPREGAARAVRAGANILASAMRNRAPHLTGRTAAAIKVQSLRVKKGVTSITAGLTAVGFKAGQLYGAFVNYGWLTGRRGSKHRNQIQGTHWIEKGVADAQAAALSEVESTIAKEIDSITR